MDARTLVDYAKSLDCIHCGLCLNTCPTYQLTGRESSSPRGRIHLMRSVAEHELEPGADFVEEMDFCLLCRHCESVCPSGVHFGAMMEHTRGALEPIRPRKASVRFLRKLGFGALTDRSVLRVGATFARVAQLAGVLRFLPGGRSAPHFPPARERELLPTITPARGERRATVAVLEGCVMPELFGRVNRATVRVLSAIGIESRVVPGPSCCGSLHAHNGELEGARALARGTIEAFEEACDEDGAPLTIVVNSAGCGSHMKEYAALFHGEPRWRERAEQLAARVKDFSEFLATAEHVNVLRGELRRSSHLTELGRITYDDPCHLCHGQGIRKPPRALLDLVPGLERVEMPSSEACCGSAGIYSLARPDDARAVLAPKLVELVASGARTLVTANPGCQIQWQSGIDSNGLDVRVLHIAEVLERALLGA